MYHALQNFGTDWLEAKSIPYLNLPVASEPGAGGEEEAKGDEGFRAEGEQEGGSDESRGWYYLDAVEQQHGPFTSAVLASMVVSNVVDTATLVWREGLPNW